MGYNRETHAVCVGYVLYRALVSFLFLSTVNDIQIPRSFLPFGPDREDLTVPTSDDGTTDEIILRTNVVIFGSSHNRLYVSQQGTMDFISGRV